MPPRSAMLTAEAPHDVATLHAGVPGVANDCATRESASTASACLTAEGSRIQRDVCGNARARSGG